MITDMVVGCGNHQILISLEMQFFTLMSHRNELFILIPRPKKHILRYVILHVNITSQQNFKSFGRYIELIIFLNSGKVESNGSELSITVYV